MIKLVVSDIDGTLVDGDGNFPGNNLETLRWLNDQGIEVMLASGRSYGEARRFTSQIDFPIGFICYNGAQTRDRQQNILEQIPMDRSKVEMLSRIDPQYPAVMLYMTSNDTCSPQSLEDYRKSYLDYCITIDKLPAELAQRRLEESLENRRIIFSSSLETLPPDDILKCEWIFLTPQQNAEVNAALSGISGVDYMSGGHFNNIEVSTKGIDKGLAVRNYCRKKGISTDEIITLGDSENDISMLEGFRNSVAMGQSPQNVREKAAYVTDEMSRGGFARAVREIIAREK